MNDYTGPEHIVTVTVHTYQTRNPDDDSLFDVVEVEHDIEHPAECDALKYGELCALDREISDGGFEYSGIPEEAGTYTVSYWSSGPDYLGEYDGGLTVEKRDAQPVEVATEVVTDPWAVTL